MSRKFKRLALTALLASSVTVSGCAQMMNFSDKVWSGTKNFTVNSGKKVATLLRPRAEREEPVFVFNERGEQVDPQAQPRVYDTGPSLREQYVIDNTYNNQPVTASQGAVQTAPAAYGASTYYGSGYETVPSPAPSSNDTYTTSSYSGSYSGGYTGGSYTYQAAPDYNYQPYDNAQYSAGEPTGQTYYYGPQSVQPEEPQQNYAHNNYSSPLPDLSYVKLSGTTSIYDWQSCQAQAGGYIEPEGTGFKIRSDFDYCMRMNGYVPEREAIQFMDAQTLP